MENKENILIVEDDEDIRTLLEKELIKSGYNPLLYSDTASAMNIIEKEKPPIKAAIVDLMNMGYGGNLGDYLKKYPQYKETKIIYHSGLTPIQFNTKILDNPNTFYVHKEPGSIKKLIKIIQGGK